ncbi:hypothetical protein B0H19DRAFT_1324606 [Mycena capillaripes]|nr:hypothetical protein B0H19DRAFT_1324606 [Mycena capillaripes]
MHTILEFAPKITDLYLTLYIWASDDVRGLCSGLSSINPRRVIFHDAVAHTGVEGEPKKNKQTEQLFNTLLELVPKWDRLQIFDFPYLVHQDTYRYGNKTLKARARALASALAKSHSLETLLVPIGDFFPKYLRQFVDVRSLKSIHFIRSQHLHRQDCYPSYYVDQIRHSVNRVPQLKALVTYTTLKSRDEESVSHPREQLSLPETFKVMSLSALRQLGKRGSNVKILDISVSIAGTIFPAVIDPIILAPFTSLTHLIWKMLETTSFSTPPPGFCVLPHLEKLSYGGRSPILLDILQPQPLNSLRDVELSEYINVPAAVAFLKCHGVKLRILASTPEILSMADVFNLCTNLTALKVTSAFSFAGAEKARVGLRFLTPDPVLICLA